MSEAKQVVREFLEATDAQQFDRYSELLAPDLVAHFPYGDLGFDETRQAEAAFAASFPDVRREIHDLIEEDGQVVARFTVRGTHEGDFNGTAPTGRRVEVTALVVYRVAQGMIRESWVQADFLGLLQQLEGE